MPMNLPDHSNEGVSLKLIAFKEEEINKIYINKVIYSILKYQTLSDNMKLFFKPKFEFVKNLHRGHFENGNIEEVKEFLESEKEKYNDIRSKNQKVVSLLANSIIGNFITGCTEHKEYTELQKVKYLLEYIVNTFKYNYDANKYNNNIPFGMDYDFEFSNSVPVSDFSSLLITREVLGNELPIIIKRLGAFLDLDIRIITAEDTNTGEIKIFNAVILHKQGKDETYKVSYIDATSAIKDEKINGEDNPEYKNPEQAFLLSRAGLVGENNYKLIYNDNDVANIICYSDKSKPQVIASIDEEHQAGESVVYDEIEIDDITDVIENDRRFIDIEYIDNDVFEKKEDRSI